MDTARRAYLYLFDSERGARGYLVARWLFLRALGAIYFSAFFALLFQVKGLVGVRGILPAAQYLVDAQQALADAGRAGWLRFWYVPSLLWISSSDHILMALMGAGLIASVLLVANVWPRAMLAVCLLCFLSFAAAAQDFSGYQSDGMLLEAGFLSLFLAPPGLWPGWGARRPAARAAQLLLLWEWFRIYFESGVVKLLSGDAMWRNLTAMYEYYQNGPLPTWVGWYAEQLPPHWFQRGVAGATLAMELVLVWMAFLPRRWRIACCAMVTLWQVGVIATANYAFLNYLVLVLAVLLLDDRLLRRFVPARWRGGLDAPLPVVVDETRAGEMVRMDVSGAGVSSDEVRAVAASAEPTKMDEEQPASEANEEVWEFRWRGFAHSAGVAVGAVALTWVFYATTAEMVDMFWHDSPLPVTPVAALEPFRIANQYGLFAVMTPHRYEIEFQGSNDGTTWTAYEFRYKPQDVRERPRIYAPYQPRFDWNLWFASLGSWLQNPMVMRAEELLLENDRDVLGLLRGNPFPEAPPRYVRAVLWQYWFSTPEEKRATGVWWTRRKLGTYSPTIMRREDGRYGVVAPASLNGPPVE